MLPSRRKCESLLSDIFESEETSLSQTLAKTNEVSSSWFGSKVARRNTKIRLVAMRPGVTPVLIPNTKVKAWAADGTALETVWESRWLPDIIFLTNAKHEFRK